MAEQTHRKGRILGLSRSFPILAAGVLGFIWSFSPLLASEEVRSAGPQAVPFVVGRLAEARDVFTPLQIDLKLALGDGALRFEGRLEGAGGWLELGFSGHQDLLEQSGRARVSLLPLRFERENLTMDELSPALAQTVGKLSGSVALEGDVG